MNLMRSNFFQIVFSNSKKRLYVLCVCIFLVFFILITRVTCLQIFYSNRLANEGNMRSLRIQNIYDIRGNITDRMGNILAISIPVSSVWINPQQINRCGGIVSNISLWIKLSKILSIPLERISCLINKNSGLHFLYLIRQIDSSIARCVYDLKLPGVYLQKEFKRHYPSSDVTAHLVGITDIDNQGIEGVEKSFNTWLTGEVKKKIVRIDRFGRVVEDVALISHGESAKDIMLSIDERLQSLAYYELNKAIIDNKAESGSVVLIDVNSGEILVMVNSPSYDPNNLQSLDCNQSFMRNRAITDLFEPGSTVKPIVVMAALQNKIAHKDTVLDTLPYTVNGYQIKDVATYNTLTVTEILQKSSNVGVSKLALSMPASVLVNMYLNFGMGKKTGIGLVGESKGIYPYNRIFWSDIDRATFSYGYGFMITPLQLAKIYTIIGAMGKSRSLSIMKLRNDDVSNDKVMPEEQQIIPSSLVRTVIDMMESSTLSGNSGSRAAIKGYSVAVKTGTVKKVGLHGKYVNQYIACAAGLAPATNPRFALVVVINNPKAGSYYGGVISAPVFKAIMSNTLRIMNVVPDYLMNHNDR